MACGIVSLKVYGAELVNNDPKSVTKGDTEEVVIQVDKSADIEQAGSPANFERKKEGKF